MSELRALARGVPGAQWRRIIDVPDPPAGQSVELPVEAKRAWRVLSACTTISTSATVANRVPDLEQADAGFQLLAAYPAGVTITAGKSMVLTWAAGVGAAVSIADFEAVAPLADPFYAFPGEVLSINGLSAAADQFANTRFVVLETYTGDVAHERNAEQSIVDHFDAIHELITYGRP